MENVSFRYSESGQKRVALYFLSLAIIGALAAYYMAFWSELIFLGVVVGGVFLAIIGMILFVKLYFFPKNNKRTALEVSEIGIRAFTTPVAKAVDWMIWEDVEDIRFARNMMHVALKDPEKYASRIKNFFVRDTFRKSMNGTVGVSLSEVDTTVEEIRQLVERYIGAQ